MEINKYLDNMFSNVDKNIYLDQEQRKIILDDSQNCMVVAGAGSGKTTVITAKVKYLVDIKKINPKEILVISFTNKAIDELKQRINMDFNLDIDIKTFHKFALNIIKKYDSNYQVIGDNYKIIQKIILSNKKSMHIQKQLSKIKTYKLKNENYNKDIDHLIDYTIESINLLKMNNQKIKSNKKMVNNYLKYLEEVEKEYSLYNSENKYLDFEDIIIKAKSIVEKIEFNYKYIIIDEYQDISQNRYDLINEILNIYDVKTIVVGDDWQAIYSFSGSRISLFTNYAKQNNAKIYLISKTYRNSQQLIDVSANFVMKNNKQIKKSLISSKQIINPICIYGYADINQKFVHIIDMIIDEFGYEKNILVLGRYKNDIKKISSNKFIVNGEKITYIKKPNVSITYMTIHAAKGLGYDNVILINAIDDDYGFPTKIKDDIIRKTINTKSSDIEEERRLFYVALTRTKNRVYILTKINKESLFVKEIIKYNNVYCDYKIRNNKFFRKS